MQGNHVTTVFLKGKGGKHYSPLEALQHCQETTEKSVTFMATIGDLFCYCYAGK